MSAILLPFTDTGEIDWPGLAAHVARTAAVGLVPAVNMDTGYGALLDAKTRSEVLEVARQEAAGEFVAGAYVDDEPGAAFDAHGYCVAMEEIADLGGLPIVFPSWGMHGLDEGEIPARFAELGASVDRFLAFELGEMFLAQGRVFTIDTYRSLLTDVPQCVGAKHSSLRRNPEWDRLAVRDEVRPDFLVLTGNDLAIDMVMYGSDYLLGLSTFAPEAFALRDSYWAKGDARFHELNDLLQYLGFFAFRDPIPSYRHDAAMFLHRRGLISTSRTHSDSATRPDSDLPVLSEIADRLDQLAGEMLGAS